MTHTFAVPRKTRHCACCGVQVLSDRNEDMGYTRLHFSLSDGTVAPVSFCVECAGHDWDEDRLQQLEHQCHEGWKAEGSPKPTWSHEGLRFLRRDVNYPPQTWQDVQ